MTALVVGCWAWPSEAPFTTFVIVSAFQFKQSCRFQWNRTFFGLQYLGWPVGKQSQRFHFGSSYYTSLSRTFLFCLQANGPRLTAPHEAWHRYCSVFTHFVQTTEKAVCWFSVNSNRNRTLQDASRDNETFCVHHETVHSHQEIPNRGKSESCS